jgi:hypothetical protein
MLAGLALKKRWMAKRKAAGLPYDKPNLIMSSTTQVDGGATSLLMGSTRAAGSCTGCKRNCRSWGFICKGRGRRSGGIGGASISQATSPA